MSKDKFSNALSAPEGLVKHWSFHGARFDRKERYRGQDIFLGDGGPHHDADLVKDLDVGDAWMLDGYYVSVFAIQRGRAFFGVPCYFKLNHDSDHTDAQRRVMRVGTALEAAKRIIDDGMDIVSPPIFVNHESPNLGLVMPPNESMH